jgi:hypothetical protein
MSSRNLYSVNTADLVSDFTMNLAQAAATYTLCTAVGDVCIWGMGVFCTVAGTNWTSVTIQTNDTTNFVFMNSTEGARANFTAGKNVSITWAQVQKPLVRSGQLVQYTIAGTTGVGTARVQIYYYSLAGGDLV